MVTGIVKICMTAIFASALLTGCAAHKGSGNTPFEKLLQGKIKYRTGGFIQAKRLVQAGLADALTNRNLAVAAQFYALSARLDEATGHYDESISDARECLTLASNLTDLAIKKECLIRLASTYRRKGDFLRALQLIDKAKAQDDFSLSSANYSELLLVSGAIRQGQGNAQLAIADYEAAMTAARNVGDQFLEARAVNNLGGVFRETAQYNDAHQYYQRALTLRIKLKDRAGLVSTYGNICSLYSQLGDYANALRNCRRSFRIARQIGSLAQQAATLNSMGAIYRQRNNARKAIKAYSKSAELKRAAGDKIGLARTLNNVGEIHIHDGDYRKALRHFSEAIQITKEIGQIPLESGIWGNIGSAYLQLSEYEEAQEAFNQAIVVGAVYDDPEREWRHYANLCLLFSKMEKPQVAIFFGKQSVNTIQRARANVSNFDKQRRQSFAKNKRFIYEKLSDLLIDQGRLHEAMQVLGLLKEEEYLDYTQQRSSIEIDSRQLANTKIEQENFDRTARIYETLIKIYPEYRALFDKLETERTVIQKERLNYLTLKVRMAREEFNLALSEVTKEFEQFDSHRQLELGEKLLKSLGGLQGIIAGLNKDVALLHYLVTPDKLRIILTSAKDRKDRLPNLHKDSPVKKKRLSRKIFEFADLLERPGQSPVSVARELYDWTIKPIRKELDELGIKHLIIYLDDVMRYIPIAALHDGEQYLVDRFSVSLYTSAARGFVKDEPNINWRVAGLGVSRSTNENVRPLPGVEWELDNIVKEGNAKEDEVGVIPGEVYINSEFTKHRLQSVLNESSRPYQVLHIASHYFYHPDPELGEESFLLTGDGRITLRDFSPDEYPMGELDLITLSACETAVGSRTSEGQEVEGLATKLQQLGAKSVIATLWKVEDRSAALFMQAFYQTHETKKELTKAETLQVVQRKFINGDIKPLPENGSARGAANVLESQSTSDTPANYAHPSYWAPFILMGNFL